MNSLRFKLAFALAAMLVWSVGDAQTRALPSGRVCTSAAPSTKHALPANMCFQFDVAYGSDPKQKFDVYMPKTPVPGAPASSSSRCWRRRPPSRSRTRASTKA